MFLIGLDAGQEEKRSGEEFLYWQISVRVVS